MSLANHWFSEFNKKNCFRPVQPGYENENETDTHVSFCKKSTARPNLFHENENETDTQHVKFCRIF